jgi:hypothetical protein
LIPHALSRGSQIPFNVLSPKAGTSKQSLEQKLPVEDSADEVFTSIEEDTIFRKRLALQPKASRPSRHTLSSAEEYDGEELLEDCFRPPKRRFVSSYSVIKTSRATTRRTKTIQHKTSIASRKKSSIREPFSTTRRSSPSLNDFDYDSELPLTSELVRAGYTAHRTVKENQKPKGIPDYVSFIKLSDLGEAGSEADADAEFDSGSESGQSPISWDSSNEIKTSKSKPTRNYRGGTKKNMDEEVLKHRLETKATPHIRRVVSFKFIFFSFSANNAIGWCTL